MARATRAREEGRGITGRDTCGVREARGAGFEERGSSQTVTPSLHSPFPHMAGHVAGQPWAMSVQSRPEEGQEAASIVGVKDKGQVLHGVHQGL